MRHKRAMMRKMSSMNGGHLGPVRRKQSSVMNLIKIDTDELKDNLSDSAEQQT